MLSLSLFLFNLDIHRCNLPGISVVRLIKKKKTLALICILFFLLSLRGLTLYIQFLPLSLWCFTSSFKYFTYHSKESEKPAFQSTRTGSGKHLAAKQVWEY